MDEVNKDTVAEQLAKISEQLAIKNRRSKRIWKIVGIVYDNFGPQSSFGDIWYVGIYKLFN